jgi:hypothetical protein
MLSSSQAIFGQEIKVLVLDALNGKPEANIKVMYFCTGTLGNSPHQNTATDALGLAKISNPCSDGQEINISVYPPKKKEQCGVGLVSLKDILSTGVVSKPDSDGGIWCPTKRSRTLKPVPGQIILFVKKPTWWQSHIAG